MYTQLFFCRAVEWLHRKEALHFNFYYLILSPKQYGTKVFELSRVPAMGILNFLKCGIRGGAVVGGGAECMFRVAFLTAILANSSYSGPIDLVLGFPRCKGP